MTVCRDPNIFDKRKSVSSIAFSTTTSHVHSRFEKWYRMTLRDRRRRSFTACGHRRRCRRRRYPYPSKIMKELAAKNIAEWSARLTGSLKHSMSQWHPFPDISRKESHLRAFWDLQRFFPDFLCWGAGHRYRARFANGLRG